MLRFLTQLWRWIKSWFIHTPAPPPPPPTELDDLELENLFMALLEEVAKGNSWGQLQGFLVGRKVNKERLAQWLKRFGERWATQSEPDPELVRRLVLLGQVATGELGATALELRERLERLRSSAVNSEGASQSDSARAWVNRGNALSDLGQYEETVASYDQALKLHPTLHQAWNNQGDALYDLGRYEEAVASYDQVLKLHPTDPTAWYNRGNALSYLGRDEEAVASYDQALKLYPIFHQAWNNQGETLCNLGRYEEAVASYDQVLKLYPTFHEVWSNRGSALYHLGRYEEAVASYDQVLKLHPTFHQAWISRGLAAGKSLYEIYYQQQFVELFRLEVSNATQRLVSAFESTAPTQHLAQLQTSLSSSTSLLLNTFAHLDAPELINFIQQPPSPELAQLIQQSPPPELIALVQQPLSPAVIAQLNLDFFSHPHRLNSQLNLRGYEGQLASFQAELDKAIRQDTHPEGWGRLHHTIGTAHYFQGRRSANPFSFWSKAQTSYKTALQTLKPPEFEQRHLDVLRDLIRVLLDLREQAEAEELQRQGADLLRRMLADPKRTQRQKRELALKSATFDQFSVDLTLQSGDILGALMLAETGKNTCLGWLLDEEETPSIDYAQIQQLLDPTTAAVYWHLSSSALTTFVILPGAPAPAVIQSKGVEAQGTQLDEQRPDSLLQVLAWEEWLKDWNLRYQAYGSSKGKKDTLPGEEGDKKQHPWRNGMHSSLERLKQILQISAIEQHFRDHSIENLILIPHRDIHRFPLHIFFENCTCTYLPSAYLGIQKKQPPLVATGETALSSLLIVENPKSTLQVNGLAKSFPPLPFAEVEAALVRQLFSGVTAIKDPAVNTLQLKQSLNQPHQVFHFTGHGAYDSTNPAQSCLFLSGNELLTLLDIIHLDLSAYHLVCLAACETAVTGNQTITDEYVGLVSAFLKAGASYVVSTLWTVESAASALLMVEFYQQLQAHQPPAKALKTAQFWLRDATREQLIEWLDGMIPKLNKERALRLVLEDQRELISRMDHQPFNHPYYWAAFTISGT